jgi:molybdopterin/thiamine biosynthesis adenylyltransferase
MSITYDNLAAGKTVTVIGAGNIGSQLLGHLARMPEVRRITCVDPDQYGPDNLSTQDIGNADIGVAKAPAAARRLRRIRENLEITAIVDRVENVPWGRLRADAFCGCVDSKAARASINLVARRLGTPYVDAGIRADGLLARVDVYGPGPGGACLECGWGKRDYESLGTAWSCTGEPREAPRSGAGSALGGLAAAMQALECRKLLEGGAPDCLFDRQVVIEAVRHHLFVNVLRQSPVCRFDHRKVQIHAARAETLADLQAQGTTLLGQPAEALAVERKSWVTQVACRSCGEQAPVLRLQGRLDRQQARCPRCREQRQAVGFGMMPRLNFAFLPPERLAEPLSCIGLADGDVVSVRGADREVAVEVNGPHRGQGG